MLDLKLLAEWRDFELVERSFIVDSTCIYHASNKNLLNVWPTKIHGAVLELIVDWTYFTGKDEPFDDWIVESTWWTDTGVNIFSTEWTETEATIFIHGGSDRAVYEVKNFVLFNSGKREERTIKYIIDNQVGRKGELSVIHIY